MGVPIKVVPKGDSFYDNYDKIFGSKRRKGYTLTSSFEKFERDWSYLRNLLSQENDIELSTLETMDESLKTLHNKVLGE